MPVASGVRLFRATPRPGESTSRQFVTKTPFRCQALGEPDPPTPPTLRDGTVPQHPQHHQSGTYGRPRLSGPSLPDRGVQHQPHHPSQPDMGADELAPWDRRYWTKNGSAPTPKRALSEAGLARRRAPRLELPNAIDQGSSRFTIASENAVSPRIPRCLLPVASGVVKVIRLPLCLRVSSACPDGVSVA
jgi:hypothetical protein